MSKSKKKSPILLLVVATVILCLGFLAYKFFYTTSDQNTTLTTVSVSRGDIENVVTATGTINPKNYVDIGSQVSGQVMRLNVEVGDIVKVGDLLAEIDTTVLETKVESSKAELKYQEAQLVDREASLLLATLTYERQKELFENNATSQESYQSAQASLKSAKASIDMIKAQIIQTKASSKENEANLAYARIYATMNGTVVSIEVKKGQTLNANQNTPTILRIADLSTMSIEADVSEADVNKLTRGMEVYFKILGSENIWHTNLTKIEPTPTTANNVVLYRAVFNVENPTGDLMISMTTQVFFVLASAKDTLIVPTTSIASIGKDKFVTVLKDDKTTDKRRVEIGVSSRIQTQILVGLKEGEKIILNNQVSTKKGTVSSANSMPRMIGRI